MALQATAGCASSSSKSSLSRRAASSLFNQPPLAFARAERRGLAPNKVQSWCRIRDRDRRSLLLRQPVSVSEAVPSVLPAAGLVLSALPSDPMGLSNSSVSISNGKYRMPNDEEKREA
eukprot:scaffold294562_cov23-Tisochrysis_lutea.AAC.3